MAFNRFEFTKNWTSAENFPTVQNEEAQVREDMQFLHDEAKDGLNGLMNALEAPEAAGSVGALLLNSAQGTVQDALNELAAEVRDVAQINAENLGAANIQLDRDLAARFSVSELVVPNVADALAVAVPQVVKFYATGTDKNADELLDPAALIPVKATVNSELYAIVGGTYAYVWTTFYGKISTDKHRVQLACSHNGVPRRLAFRNFFAGAWSPWREVASAEEFLRLTGGKLTGDVVVETESGPALGARNTSTGREALVLATNENETAMMNRESGDVGEGCSGILLHPESHALASILQLHLKKQGENAVLYDVLHTGNMNLIDPEAFGAAHPVGKIECADLLDWAKAQTVSVWGYVAKTNADKTTKTGMPTDASGYVQVSTSGNNGWAIEYFAPMEKAAYYNSTAYNNKTGVVEWTGWSKVATTDYAVNKAGDVVPGNIMTSNADPVWGPSAESAATRVRLFGGKGADEQGGANIALHGKGRTEDAGAFKIVANDGTNESALVGKPDGELMWKEQPVARIVSGTYMGTASIHSEKVEINVGFRPKTVLVCKANEKGEDELLIIVAHGEKVSTIIGDRSDQYGLGRFVEPTLSDTGVSWEVPRNIEGREHEMYCNMAAEYNYIAIG